MPVSGHYRIKKAKNCYALSWVGRKACEAGQAIYETGRSLYPSKKFETFESYIANIGEISWSQIDRRRFEVVRHLLAGVPPMQVSAMLNEHFQTVYSWRAQLANGEIDEGTGKIIVTCDSAVS